MSHANLNQLNTVANALLDALDVWSKNNCISVNRKKTKAILFRPRNKKMYIALGLKIGGEEIEIVSSLNTWCVLFGNPIMGSAG